MNNSLIIFTDGASRGNPGRGGWGVIIAGVNTVIELGGREDHTTNNRMELFGLISALEHLNVRKNEYIEKSADIYIDSRYVLNGVQKWLSSWQKGGWKTKAKKDVLNRDLWEKLATALDTVQKTLTLSWYHVDGHVGIPANERVDEIATGLADGKHTTLYDGPRATYKVDINTLKGDVPKKSDKNKSRSGKPAYSYVSVVNGIIETHKTWAECERRVKGVSKSRFQKVFSANEEKDLIESYKTHAK